MNPNVLKMKHMFIDVMANISAWLGAITSWQISLDFWVKIFAGVSAITLSWLTIYIRLKAYRANEKDKNTDTPNK